MGEFYQTFKEESMAFFFKLLKKNLRGKSSKSHFFEASIILTSMPGKIRKRKTTGNLDHEYRWKNSQENVSKLNLATQ